MDAYTNPQAYIHNAYVKWGLYTVSLVDSRAALLPLDETLQHVYDPYAFIRNAWLQRREFLVTDGNVGDVSSELEEGMDVDPADEQPPPDPQPETPPPPK